MRKEYYSMLKICNIKEKQEFLQEVAELTQKERGKKTNPKSYRRSGAYKI